MRAASRVRLAETLAADAAAATDKFRVYARGKKRSNGSMKICTTRSGANFAMFAVMPQL
jgi:hypothetical protein